MNDDLKGYKLVASAAWSGSGAENYGGYRIYVRRPPEVEARIAALDDKPRPDHSLTPREIEDGRFYPVTQELERLLKLQAAQLDPATAARAAAERAGIVKAFESAFPVIFVEETKNQYWPDAYSESVTRPWYCITTPIGRLTVGWRKRVIEVDWKDSLAKSFCGKDLKHNGVGKDADDPVYQATAGDTFVHAWSYERLVNVLTQLRDHVAGKSTP